MDKLTMAHDYAKEFTEKINDPCKVKTKESMRIIAENAWNLADAMQAEADKRKCNPELPPLQQTFINGIEQPRYAPPCDEWQPDWSQAPAGFNRFVVDSDGGRGFFTNIEPELIGDYYFVGLDGVVFDDHGYKGNWQDSLRKRPEGK